MRSGEDESSFGPLKYGYELIHCTNLNGERKDKLKIKEKRE